MVLEIQTMSLRLLRALIGFTWLLVLSAAGHAQVDIDSWPGDLAPERVREKVGWVRAAAGLVMRSARRTSTPSPTTSRHRLDTGSG